MGIPQMDGQHFMRSQGQIVNMPEIERAIAASRPALPRRMLKHPATNAPAKAGI
jgi:hypothetical protein